MSAENGSPVKQEFSIQKTLSQLSDRPYGVPTTTELLNKRPYIPIHGSMAEKGLSKKQPIAITDLNSVNPA